MEACKQLMRLLEGIRFSLLTWASSGVNVCAVKVHSQVGPVVCGVLGLGGSTSVMIPCAGHKADAKVIPFSSESFIP